MIKWLKKVFTRKTIKIQSGAALSVIEFDPSKHYFVIVEDQVVNIDDILNCRAVGSGGSMTIVRKRGGK